MKVIPKKQELVDLSTGESVDVISFIPEKRDKGFVKVFNVYQDKVLQDLNLLNGALKTLTWFVTKVSKSNYNGDNEFYAPPKVIAKDIGLSEVQIYRHLITLKNLKYICQIDKRVHLYKLNPEYVYKGSLTYYFNNL